MYRPPLAVALASVLLGCGGGGGGASTPGLIVVVWSAPPSNTDGSVPADVARYRVTYGTDPQQLTQSIDVSGAAATTAQIGGVSAGTYYLRVQAFSTSGVASDPSNTAVITPP